MTTPTFNGMKVSPWVATTDGRAVICDYCHKPFMTATVSAQHHPSCPWLQAFSGTTSAPTVEHMGKRGVLLQE